MKRTPRALLVLFVCVTAGALPGAKEARSQSIPVYVYPTLRIWTVHLESEPTVIVDALERLADESRLSLERIPGEGSLYRLEERRLNHKELKEYCHYPIHNLRDWKPVKTFQEEFRDAVMRNRRRDWDGRVRLDLYIPSDRDHALVVATSCYSFLFHQGRGVLATSRAVYERVPLESLAASLGSKAPVAVEPLPQIEPDLDGMRGNEPRIVQTCGFTGVYMNPETGEVSCTPPRGMNLIDRTGVPTAGESSSASSFSIRAESAEEPKPDPPPR
jgi:hypothetical protein